MSLQSEHQVHANGVGPGSGSGSTLPHSGSPPSAHGRDNTNTISPTTATNPATATLQSSACPHARPSRLLCTPCRASLQQSLIADLDGALPNLLRQDGWVDQEVEIVIGEQLRYDHDHDNDHESLSTVQQLLPAIREGTSAGDIEEMEMELQRNVTWEMARRVQEVRNMLREKRKEKGERRSGWGLVVKVKVKVPWRIKRGLVTMRTSRLVRIGCAEVGQLKE